MHVMTIACSPVAQSVEQVAVNHWVGGSSPSRGAMKCLDFQAFIGLIFLIGYTPGILLDKFRLY